MKHIRRLTTIGVALTGLFVATPKASVDHTSYVTFSEPVALPGAILPAGTYIFDLPAHDLSLVRVKNRDGSKVFLTAFTRIVNRPPKVRPDLQVTLGEAQNRQAAPRVLVWYPVATETGREFIYVE